MQAHLRTIGEAETQPHQGGRHEAFRLIFHEAVVSGLTGILGEAGARAAFFHLKFTEAATANEVHRGLVRIFGRGTQSLEFSVLGDLYARVGSAFEPEESLTFSEFVEEAKKRYSRLREA